MNIGIEIGGTKLQVGVGTSAGELIALARAQVDPQLGAAGIRSRLLSLVEDALQQSQSEWSAIERIGIGFGGPFDSKRGITLRSFQIDGWDHFPLKTWAEEHWQRPVIIGNDAATAGLAEALLGAGKGYGRVFYMTIGSGIGGGWIVDGKIDRGQGLGAAEVGHMLLPNPDEKGSIQELELICSGWSIGRRAQQMSQSRETKMVELAGTQSQIDAKIVYAAAEAGDPLALEILQSTCRTLAIALNNIVVMLHPQQIIIGGGVGQMGQLFWDALRAHFAALAFAPFAPTVEVVPAHFGEQVVLIGALCLAKEG